jgi:hypothetical protein
MQQEDASIAGTSTAAFIRLWELLLPLLLPLPVELLVLAVRRAVPPTCSACTPASLGAGWISSSMSSGVQLPQVRPATALLLFAATQHQYALQLWQGWHLATQAITTLHAAHNAVILSVKAAAGKGLHRLRAWV